MTGTSGAKPGSTYSFWKFPDRGITGGYLAVAGVGMAAYGLGRLLSFGVFDVGWIAVALAAGAVYTGVRWMHTPHGAWVGPEMSIRSLAAGWAHLPGAGGVLSALHHDKTPGSGYEEAISRINQLLRKQGKDDSPWGVILHDATVSDTDGNLVKYAIEVEESGHFTKESNRNRVRSLLSQAVPGKWRVRFNPIKDIATVELAKEFPSAVPPPPKRPATTEAEILSRYLSSRWTLGVNALGESIGPKPISIPHAVLVAGSGGGKSVWARELIEDKRSDGWMVFLGDGKGTDFTALSDVPNVVMVSNEPAQHVVLVRAVRREMDRRYAEADRAKRSGQGASAFDFPPLLVLLDEFASMRQEVIELDCKDKDKPFVDDIAFILRKGREARVHMVISSQELRAAPIPGSWQENLKLVVSLGRPTDQTLNRNVFPGEYKSEVKLIGDRITAQGRGVYVDVDEGEVVEFQSFYGWSPGTTTLRPGTKNSPPTPEVAAAWEEAAAACEQVRSFYPRIGIMADGPEWRDPSQGLEAIASTPTVILDSREGPIPDRVKYDPWSPEWAGAVPLDGSATSLRFAEPDDPLPKQHPDGDSGRKDGPVSVQKKSLEEQND